LFALQAGKVTVQRIESACRYAFFTSGEPPMFLQTCAESQLKALVVLIGDEGIIPQRTTKWLWVAGSKRRMFGSTRKPI
jgi:hypothetical protein